jgi:TnpA family transposase
MAREGGQMTSRDLGKYEPQRKYATLVALVLEGTATVIDQIIDLHHRIIGKLLNAARHKHQLRFQQSGRKINDQLLLYGKIGRALVKAKAEGNDAFAAIETVIPWDEFEASIAETGKLSQPEEFDFIHLLAENYPNIRRYAPALLEVLQLKAAPAGRAVLEAVEQIRSLNAGSLKELPADAPTAFIKKRWEKLVRTDQGLNRKNYELCLLCELKNSLRSGDIWVKGSRQFKDFEDYLIPAPAFGELSKTGTIPLSVNTDGEAYLKERTTLLEEQLALVNGLALANNLPDALITEAGLKMTPLDAAVPPAAQDLIDRTAALLPHIKITELLLEVDAWTGFTRHFTHLKTGEPVKDKTLLLTAVLADAINLRLVKMAASCPGAPYSQLSWMQAWHIRDDTYAAALADLVNAQLRHPFAANWGDGTTSSSDGQRFKSGGRAESTGHVNPKYGSDPGRMFYTHLSDQYSPFSTQVVNVGVRDATYVLDGLLYHESDLRIEEHYTDTAGFTDHVFGMMHLLGFRFTPLIRDLNETRLFVLNSEADFSSLKPLIGGKINLSHIRANWDELLRLASSIRQGTVTASLILRKLAAYPRQNGLAVALREVGRIERNLFILTWLQSTELRRRFMPG